MNIPSGPTGPSGPGRRRTGSLIWGSEIPFRNPDFVGREEQIIALREQLETGGPAVITQPSDPVTKHPPGTLFGLGGVGKTEIATEYAHRYQDEYDVVWWVRAEQEDSIRASLVALGRRLRLPDAGEAQRDREYRAVIEALAAREPYRRWLLIFDNVTQPDMVLQYLPPGGGHVIITSRRTGWRQELRTDGIEVREFPLADSVAFLRKRVPRLYHKLDPDTMECDTPEREEEKRQRDAERLAATLGNLPLAVDHAASYLAQTGTPVSEYIDAFESNAHELFSRDADRYSADNMTVATTWSVTRKYLSAEARELFELLSFFSAEPISEEILIRPVIASSLSAGLRRVLSDRARSSGPSVSSPDSHWSAWTACATWCSCTRSCRPSPRAGLKSTVRRRRARSAPPCTRCSPRPIPAARKRSRTTRFSSARSIIWCPRGRLSRTTRPSGP